MQREFAPAIYLMANRMHGTLYVGVTSNLMQRIGQHREGVVEGFTRRYDISRLVWFEMHGINRARNSVREVDQEVASGMEGSIDRGGQSRLA